MSKTKEHFHEEIIKGQQGLTDAEYDESYQRWLDMKQSEAWWDSEKEFLTTEKERSEKILLKYDFI